MTQGMSDEQNREMQRGLIMIQMRRYLRFFWIGVTLLMAIPWILKGGGLFDSIATAILWGVVGYGLTVIAFIHLLANFAIRIFLYLKSLFGGEARL